MLDLAHGAAIAGSQLLQHDEVFRLEVQPELDPNLQGILLRVGVSEPAGNLRIAGGRRRGGLRSRVEGEVADVLPLHRLGLERIGRHGGGVERGTAAWRTKGQGRFTLELAEGSLAVPGESRSCRRHVCGAARKSKQRCRRIWPPCSAAANEWPHAAKTGGCGRQGQAAPWARLTRTATSGGQRGSGWGPSCGRATAAKGGGMEQGDSALAGAYFIVQSPDWRANIAASADRDAAEAGPHSTQIAASRDDVCITIRKLPLAVDKKSIGSRQCVTSRNHHGAFGCGEMRAEEPMMV